MNLYQHTIQNYTSRIVSLEKALQKLSTYRLLAFVTSILLILILANAKAVILVLIAFPVCVLGFGQLIRRYNRVAYLQRHLTFLKEINENEVLRQENKLANFPAGRHFINRDHPYLADLDIFGDHSLFQLINRATTESGQVMLAKWLASPASKEILLERQQAVKELSPKSGWRQHFQAAGMHFHNAKSDYTTLLAWIEKPVQLLPHQTKYMMVCIFLAILSTTALVNFFIHLFTPDWFMWLIPLVIISVINSRLLKRVSSIAEEIITHTHHNVKILGGYHSLITTIESEKFHTERLTQLQSVFSQKGYSAAGEINKLKNILETFKQRGTKKEIGRNTIYTIFNTLWLLDIYWIIQTEKWKNRNSASLKEWASAVSEFEVLSSIAGFSYSNPAFTFPHIKEDPYTIHFQHLGHPLISPKNRVCNHFTLQGRGEIAMITGSNMAGKSTFLRAVGVNLVLSLMGAPCCAESAQVSNMKLFTSMRTQDNLQEGVSSFYAELKRIEQLLKLIENGEPIFFLLDEMFKGTNSQDRYKGGISLIKQLSELNSFGMISTHDLELARLTATHMMVANYSFNSEIREGEMLFNYILTEGICTDFNASELMKKSGINILSDIEQLQSSMK